MKWRLTATGMSIAVAALCIGGNTAIAGQSQATVERDGCVIEITFVGRYFEGTSAYGDGTPETRQTRGDVDRVKTTLEEALRQSEDMQAKVEDACKKRRGKITILVYRDTTLVSYGHTSPGLGLIRVDMGDIDNVLNMLHAERGNTTAEQIVAESKLTRTLAHEIDHVRDTKHELGERAGQDDHRDPGLNATGEDPGLTTGPAVDDENRVIAQMDVPRHERRFYGAIFNGRAVSSYYVDTNGDDELDTSVLWYNATPARIARGEDEIPGTEWAIDKNLLDMIAARPCSEPGAGKCYPFRADGGVDHLSRLYTSSPAASKDVVTAGNSEVSGKAVKSGGAGTQDAGVPRLSASFSAVPSRVDLKSQFGGGVRVFNGEIFASKSPDSIWRTGFELRINLDLGAPDLFGAPALGTRLFSSGRPTTKLYASFSYASGDDENRYDNSESDVDYGIVFAEMFGGSTGYGLYSGINGFGLDSVTRTDNTWFRGGFGLESKFPNAFNNDRLTATGHFGLFFEKFKTDYDADTVFLLNGSTADIYGRQTTSASSRDRYFGAKAGGTLSYAVTDRFRIGVGGDLYVSHRSSSASVTQDNSGEYTPPLDNFQLNYNYDDSGLAIGLGASISAEFDVTDRLRLTARYERASLPGVTSIFLPENPDKQPIRFDNEKICRDFFSLGVNYQF